MKSTIAMFALILSIPAFADSVPTRCGLNCEVPPKCEALAKQAANKFFGADSEKFDLWGVGIVTANTPDAYQLEYYGVPGTTNKPGHLLIISYGYKDARNPNGFCRIEWIDERCASCDLP